MTTDNKEKLSSIMKKQLILTYVIVAIQIIAFLAIFFTTFKATIDSKATEGGILMMAFECICFACGWYSHEMIYEEIPSLKKKIIEEEDYEKDCVEEED